MKREFRVVKKDKGFCPEWRSFWTFWRWRKFYFTKNYELEDFVYLRVFETENEAWNFIQEKKCQPKFKYYDLIDGGED
jgi:hypothetical protein